MIYRKWSLLSSTAVVTSGIIGAVVVGHFVFVEQNPFTKPELNKENGSSSK